jgi:hypothetical protein
MNETQQLKRFAKLLSHEIRESDSASKLVGYLKDSKRTGREFHSYQRSQNDVNIVSPADLIAVSLLSVRIAENPSSLKPSSILLLDKESIASRIKHELQKIPVNVSIESVGRDEYLEYIERSRIIWSILEKDAEINSRVVRYKLLARKRPLLFPIRDSVLDKALQSRSLKNWYFSWYQAFHDSEFEIRHDLIEVKKEAQNLANQQIDLGLLRIADMIIWERWLHLCELCKFPISICIECDGWGHQEPHSAGSFLEPYPCPGCSGWDGDPENMEFWDSSNGCWRQGVGSGCETEGCPGSKGRYRWH